MKKFLTFLTLLTLSIGVSWAATMTYTPTVNTGAGTVTGGPSDLTLTNSHSGGNSMQSGQGLQITTSYSPFTATISGMTSSYKVTKIVVTYCTNASKGAGTISTKIGDTQVGSTFTVSKTGGTTLRTATLYDDANGTSFVDGEVFTINITCTTNSVYLNKVEIDYEENSGTPSNQVAKPTITLDPASGPYYVGDEVTATITCAEEGATIYYATDNTAPTTTSATIENGGTLTITSDCTIKAFAVKADMNDSEIAEKEVSFTSISTANTVAQILALEGGTKFKFTGNLVVSGKSGNQLYAQDETGGIHFYGSTPNYTFGDVIPAGFIATFVADYNGAPELTTMERMAEATTHGEQLDAATLTPSQITANNENAFIYAVIKNATISGTTITANGETVTVQTTFSNDLPTDGKSYDFYGITNWNNGGKFMILSYEETYIDPGEGYYLVGNFSGWKRYENYKFTEAEGSLVLNNVTLPDNAEFKIVNKTSSSEIWYGGQTDNTDQAKLYVLHGEWHTDIPLTNSENNNYVKNFSIAAGGVTSFTFNTSTMKFDALRAAQVYFTCDKINNWAKEAMTATDNGWTITKQLEEGAKFAFIDEWGGHHGNDWTIKPEHYGDNYDIPLGNANTPTMQDAGYYKLDVNSALTVMHVNKEFAINCSADPNGGGNVTAKVGGVTVTSAMAGETVTIEYTTANGYTFNNITLNGTALEAVEGVYSFTMPNADANVVVNYNAVPLTITVNNDDAQGTVTGLPETATVGSPISFTVTPNTDYKVSSVTYTFTPANGSPNTQTLTADEEGNYTFNMPAYAVTVDITYKAKGVAGEWTLVTDDSQLVAGNEFIIVSRTAQIGGSTDTDYKHVALKVNTTENYQDATTDIELSEDYSTATPGENVSIFKLEGSEGAWKLGDGNGTNYLYLNSNANRLFFGEPSETNNVSDAEVEIAFDDENVALIKFKNFPLGSGNSSNSPRYIKQYNQNQSGTRTARFSTYATNQQPVYLYTREVETPAESITLAGLVALGAEADGNKYCINEDLLGVKKSADGKTIWFKDDNGYATPDEPQSSHNTYEIEVKTGDMWYSKGSFDQSNWIEVVFPSEANYDEIYVKNLTGTYSYNGGNPKLTVTKTDNIVENGTGSYTPNRYCIANFKGTQEGHYTNNGSQVECTYFFVTPKPQEYAEIIDAVYSNNSLSMPSNNNGVSGTVSVDLSKNSSNGDDLEDGNVYSGFNVIVSKVVRSSMLKADADYVVSPVNLTSDNDVPTAISTVAVSGDVKSVKYVNVAGVVSDRPFQGVNIVVTEYTDGSRTTAKMVR